MIRFMPQAVLFLALCPVLVAQQAAGSGQGPAVPESHPAAPSKGATITLPRGTTVGGWRTLSEFFRI